jgi:hypothetical protein
MADMLNHLGTTEWRSFQYAKKESYGRLYYIDKPALSYSLAYNDEKFAIEMVTKLNALATDTDLYKNNKTIST